MRAVKSNLKSYKVKLHVDNNESEMTLHAVNVNGVLTQLKTEIREWHFSEYKNCDSLKIEINLI